MSSKNKLLFIFALTLLLLPRTIFAQQEKLPVLVPLCEKYPCPKIVEITAYYSPLPFQEDYFTGSYEGDLKLNGNGTNGADGTEVYPGMIAAPKNYPFGLQIEIPDFGRVTVHDRGGAIKAANSNEGREYDRLDLWMGHGMSGLKRASEWGRRIIKIKILDPSQKFNDQVNFENLGLDTSRIGKSNAHIYQYQYFPVDLSFGMQNQKVAILQKYLVLFGINKNFSSSIYDKETLLAVTQFQTQNKIIKSDQDFGAGYFGPKTREIFEQEIKKYENHKFDFLSQNIGKLEASEAIKILQKHLVKMKLLASNKITGIYDQESIAAIYTYQIQNKIVKNELDHGAGYFGPKTRQSFKETLIALENQALSPSLKIEIADLSPKLPKSNHQPYFVSTLKFSDKGTEVLRLQTELKTLGFLSIPETGFFGKITENALTKLQLSEHILNPDQQEELGKFGPYTKAYLNKLIANRDDLNRRIAQKKADILIARAKENSLENNLKIGDQSDEVKILQKFLVSTGYLKNNNLTGYFGEKTKKALIAFQIENKIIQSSSEKGAGTLGPKTRQKVSELLSA